MKSGTVSKLVRSFGSMWGRIQPQGETQQLFFNQSSLVDPAHFAAMVEGEAVEFDEESDRANGMHAINVRAATLSGGKVVE